MIDPIHDNSPASSVKTNSIIYNPGFAYWLGFSAINFILLPPNPDKPGPRRDTALRRGAQRKSKKLCAFSDIAV